MVQYDARHAHVGFVDHLSVERHGSATTRSRRRRTPRPLVAHARLLLRLAEHAIRRRQLRRVNALLAVEAQCPRDPTGALEANKIAEVGIRSIDATQSVRPRGANDRVHHRVPAMPRVERVILVERPNSRRGHAHRRRVVAGAKDQRLQAGRGTAQSRAPKRSRPRSRSVLRCRSSRKHRDATRSAISSVATKATSAARSGLREHDEIEPIAHGFDDVDDIAIGEGRRLALMRNIRVTSPEVELRKRANDVRAARCLLVGGNRILEIDADESASTRRRFHDHRPARRRARTTCFVRMRAEASACRHHAGLSRDESRRLPRCARRVRERDPCVTERFEDCAAEQRRNIAARRLDAASNALARGELRMRRDRGDVVHRPVANVRLARAARSTSARCAARKRASIIASRSTRFATRLALVDISRVVGERWSTA